MSSENLKLEKAQQQQKAHEDTLKHLDEKLDLAKKDTATVENLNMDRNTIISKRESAKLEKENEFK